MRSYGQTHKPRVGAYCFKCLLIVMALELYVPLGPGGYTASLDGHTAARTADSVVPGTLTSYAACVSDYRDLKHLIHYLEISEDVTYGRTVTIADTLVLYIFHRRKAMHTA